MGCSLSRDVINGVIIEENPWLSNISEQKQAELVAAGWPLSLIKVAGAALVGLLPLHLENFEKLEQIGKGTYSTVFKARDNKTGKLVAMKKVSFDKEDIKSLEFTVREIIILRRLDHPNVIKLEGLIMSRISSRLYLVFEYMEHDLAGLVARKDIKFTEEQVKCYMSQLLSGLKHCHARNVIHRDIKTSNILLNNQGTLKIADFGLGAIFNPRHKNPMTNKVVTLWYRSPELLLGATNYGIGVDLWSVGCVLAELLAGRPIMPGCTEVEQLQMIFKLCGSPSEEYWDKSELPLRDMYRHQKPQKRCFSKAFKDFPPSSLPMIETLLSLDPAERKTARDALQTEFFTTEPRACDPSSLPQYSPSKEMDAKKQHKMRRERAVRSAKRTHTNDQPVRAFPSPEANAELQPILTQRSLSSRANAVSQSKRFPSIRIDPTILRDDGSTSSRLPKNEVESLSGRFVELASAGGASQKKNAESDARAPTKQFSGRNEILFFTMEPRACDPSSLRQYSPSKEMDARKQHEMRRECAASKAHADDAKRTHTNDQHVRVLLAPEANAEVQPNFNGRSLSSRANSSSKSQRFPSARGASSHHTDPSFSYDDVTPGSPSLRFSKNVVENWERAASKAQGDAANKRTHTNDQRVLALPAPEANAELQPNFSQRSVSSLANAMSKSKRFPFAHVDGRLGASSHHINPTLSLDNVTHGSTSSRFSKNDIESWSGPFVEPAPAAGAGRKKNAESDA